MLLSSEVGLQRITKCELPPRLDLSPVTTGFFNCGLLILKGHPPVEAEAVQALLAWLVNRVESGAGILLLSTVWKSNTRQNKLSIQTKQLIVCLPFV